MKALVDRLRCIKCRKAYLRRWIHKVESHQITNAKRLEQKNNIGQVCSLNLGYRGDEHFLLKLADSVEAVGNTRGGVKEQRL